MSAKHRPVIIPGTLADSLGVIAIRALSRELCASIEVRGKSAHHQNCVYDATDARADSFGIVYWLHGR